MGTTQQWFLINSEDEYRASIERYEEVKYANKGSDEHKEKMHLVHLISEYENSIWDLPEVD